MFIILVFRPLLLEFHQCQLVARQVFIAQIDAQRLLPLRRSRALTRPPDMLNVDVRDARSSVLSIRRQTWSYSRART